MLCKFHFIPIIISTMSKYGHIFLLLVFCAGPVVSVVSETVQVACFEKDRLVIFEQEHVKGFAVDLLDYIAEQEGWELEYLPGTFPESIHTLQNRKADLILTLAYTEERDRLFDYSSEVLLTTWGRVFTRKNSEIVSLLDLDGKKVGYVTDSFFYPIMSGLLRQFELECNFIEFTSYDSLFRTISEGRIDAGLSDRLKAFTIPKNLEISEDPIVFHPYGLHVAGAEGDPRGYLSTIDRYLIDLKGKQDSIYYTRRKKWLSEASKGGMPQWLQWLFVGVTIVAAFIVVWSLSLRRQVRVRTDEINHLRTLLSNIINSMPSVLITVDQKGCILQWNREAEKRIGSSSKKTEGKELSSVLPGFSDYRQFLQQAIDEGSPVFKLRQPHIVNGEKRYEDLTIYPLIDNGVKGAVIRLDDVSEKVHLEETMIQSEKMVSVGGLAAGMAHEINNPLAGIIQNTSVVLQRLDGELPVNQRVAEDVGLELDLMHTYLEKREVLDMLRNVIGSGRRASKIVKDMLTFSRKGNLQADVTSIPELLDTTIALAQSDYQLKKEFNFSKIEIHREYQPYLPEIRCEVPKIQQVIFNILRNGAEALYGRGAPRFTLRALSTSDDKVQIEIEDNGPGIPKEVRSHLFEPFYTTKDIGKGTGLGLSVSYFIITEGHGGELMVESEPGHGARFIIRLPVQN